jgi:hypothetical protein
MAREESERENTDAVNARTPNSIDAFQSPVSISAPLTGRVFATTASHRDIPLTHAIS